MWSRVEIQGIPDSMDHILEIDEFLGADPIGARFFRFRKQDLQAVQAGPVIRVLEHVSVKPRMAGHRLQQPVRPGIFRRA